MSGRIADELRNSKPLASLEVEAALNIRRTGDFLEKWTNDVLSPAGLRGDEYNVLRILRGAGEQGHPSSEIRARMIQDADRLPAILHNLRTRALVDGTLRVSITPRGLDVLASVDGRLDQALRDRFRQFPPDTLRTVIDVMERLRADG
ncbi:hypothetical protein [Longimicrobium sp.]|uniref:hypothetical protein n=1 Tax=Longimicrobium sp. TaxID=2029185 RepID=UPI002F9438B8